MTDTYTKPLSAQEHYLVVYGRPITGAGRRRKPNKTIKERIVALQGNRCLYCEMPIGAKVTRRGNTVTLRLNWDHFIPHAYAAANSGDNWVIACHVCNGIKGPSLFDTILEAQLYIRPRWAKLGYERSAVIAIEPEAPAVQVAPSTSPEMLVVAARMTQRLLASRRILPRPRLLSMFGGSATAEEALAYLVANGHVVERLIDGKTLCSLLRQFNPKRASTPENLEAL